MSRRTEPTGGQAGVPPDAANSEAPRKVVGRRRVGSGWSVEQDTKANALAWRLAFPTPFVPKGVYRFNSHEEADDWLWKMITRKKT